MTLTYVYADQIAVLGPLATFAEPHAYDLCEPHSDRLSVPRGWEVIRLRREPVDDRPSGDDLLALADAVREAARPPEGARVTGGLDNTAGLGAGARDPRRRGHLRMLVREQSGPAAVD